MGSEIRILVIRFSSLGDVVLTTPLIRALRSAHPHDHIAFVTKEKYAPVLHGNPYLSAVETLGESASLCSLGRKLRSERFDYVLDLHDNLRSRLLRLIVPGHWSTYNKRRLARSVLAGWGWNVYRDSVPVAERYFAAAKDLGVAPDGNPPDVHPAPADLEKAARIVDSETVVLAPGSRQNTKRWPAMHWQDLARSLTAMGLRVVAVGRSDEAHLVGEPAIPAYGHRLGVAAAMLALARVVVCNDSGLMHLTTAVGTPVVAVFGPTVKDFGFFPYAPDAHVVQRNLECRPCSINGSESCPLGHHFCMREISPASVLTALQQAA